MFLGHIGVALAAKRAAPRTSLGTLLLSAQLLDGLWAALVLGRIEHDGVAPVLMAVSRPEFAGVPISHTLPVAAGLAVLFGLGYFAFRRSIAGALVVGGLVLSHPLLDLPGRYDLVTLWPGAAPVPLHEGDASILLLLESAIMVAGLVLYLRGTRARDWVGSWGLGSGLVAVIAVFAAGVLAPEPVERQAFVLALLGTFFFAPLGFWIERHRAPGRAQAAEERVARVGARGMVMGMFL